MSKILRITDLVAGEELQYDGEIQIIPFAFETPQDWQPVYRYFRSFNEARNYIYKKYGIREFGAVFDGEQEINGVRWVRYKITFGFSVLYGWLYESSLGVLYEEDYNNEDNLDEIF